MKFSVKNALSAGSGIIAGVCIFFFVIGCVLYLSSEAGFLKKTEASKSSAVIKDYENSNKNHPGLKSSDTSQSISIEEKLANELRFKYGKTIAEPGTQVHLLKFKKYLLKQYPEDGEIKFLSVLKLAFPDLYDVIIHTLAIMEKYLLWEKENQVRLAKMDYLQRERLLWEKRQEFFGDDAGNIWSEEVIEREQRKEKVKQTIALLNDAYETSIDDKLEDYQEALEAAYGKSPESYILQNKDLLSKVFFGLNSVQDELSQMDEEQRQEALKSLRRKLGYSEAQLEQLEKIDDKRNKRWKNGLAYMNERDMLAQTTQGSELENKLKLLREKYFKHEAKTIELEEKSDFYRYARTRVYGRN